MNMNNINIGEEKVWLSGNMEEATIENSLKT